MRLKLVLLAVTAVALCAGGCERRTEVSASAGGAYFSSGKDGASGGSGAGSVRIGAPVRDGGLTYRVTGVRPGPRRIGAERPQGQYVQVHLAVTNRGRRARDIGAPPKLIAGGQRYAADLGATFALGDRAGPLFEEIGPGETIRGAVVYDIPRRARPAAVDLGGTRIRLRR
ncbi:DUF4352 domain-containing protein [Actinomadura craniellae]|nr:DUF4352 domain-containing protein [Actinomadura craniellae]